MQEKRSSTVTLDVDATEVKQAMKKVRRLVKLLKEANSLADELASKTQVINESNEICFKLKVGGIAESNCDDVLREHKENIEALLKSPTGNQGCIF